MQRIQAILLGNQRVQLQHDDEGDKEDTCDSPQRDYGSGTEWVDDSAEGEHDSQAGGASEKNDRVDPVDQAKLFSERVGWIRIDAGK
jgi:hypothetical protein